MAYRECAPLLLGLLLSSTAHSATNWANILDQNGGSSVRFGAAWDGNEPFRRNEDEAFAPASLSKLFTAGALLNKVGAEYRYATTLTWQEAGPGIASQLTLTGSGDPSWGLPQIGETMRTRVDFIAQKLKSTGVHTVQGEPLIRASDARWDSLSFPSGWKEEDAFSCGGALGLSFNINLNCAVYRVSAPNRGSWTTPGISAPVDLQIKTGDGTNLKLKLVKSRGGLRIVIYGTLEEGDFSTFTLPVYDTRSWAKALFRQALLDQGIRILPAKSGRKGETKAQVFYSLPLKELLKPFLKNSVNFMGDTFLKTLAANPHAPENGDLLAASLTALRDYLYQIGMPREFSLHDGSGLSRTSRCTPKLLLEFLTHQTRETYFPALREALAVAGVDGTLRNRMAGTAAAGTLRGKTGTLDGVYNLAGYIPRGAESVPFVIVTRATATQAQTARDAEDRAGAALASAHDARSPDPSPEPYPYVPEQAGMDNQ